MCSFFIPISQYYLTTSFSKTFADLVSKSELPGRDFQTRVRKKVRNFSNLIIDHFLFQTFFISFNFFPILTAIKF